MITAGYRRQAEELFQQAVDLRPEQWHAFLDEQCPANDQVRAEVERLLAHLGGTSIRSLDAIDRMDELDIDLIGRRIGPYRLLRLIGEGGFGSVYMAQQERPIQRKVALKIIKLGMDTKQVIARFEAERQTLAMMNHPNIASVLDAGATDPGRPYFVMELVEGSPITEHCDRQCLSISARLKLFTTVCYALQHAHQKGVIHRDVKPSNVLVTLRDGTAVPKIIDFGIARAMSQPLTDKTLVTEFLQFMGTPQYMSPEQAKMSGLDTDTRTDLYSLGVILYELLTGTTPFEAKKLQGVPFGEIQQMICEEDPTIPSRRMMEMGDKLGPIAKCRGAESQVVKRVVRGDLDWIVVKALEKDRERRYQTAGDFAADIERYLRNEPVEAGRPGAGYRLRKFVRRNRVGILVASLVAAALFAGSTLAIFGLIRAREGERLAAREAETAKGINAFFTEMLASVDPMHMQFLSAFTPGEGDETSRLNGAGRDLSVAEMISAAARRADEVFAGKPELEAVARETMGTALLGLGRYADAEPQLQRTLDIRRRLFGESHPDTLRSMLAVSDLKLVIGQSDEAEPLARGAYDQMKRLYGAEHPKTLSCASILASVLADRGKYSEAENIFDETLSAQRRVLGPQHRDTLSTIWRWSVSYFAFKSLWNPAWRLSEGHDLARELYEISHRTLSPNDSLRVLSEPLLGRWLLSHRQYDRAETILRSGLQQCRRILGDTHPFTYMTTHALAEALQGKEVEEEKRSLHRQALAGLRASRGRLAWQTIGTTASFARWLAQRGDFDEAERLYRSLVEDSTRASGEEHIYTLVMMDTVADFHERIGKIDESISLRKKRLAIMGRSDQWLSPEVDEARSLLAMALMRAGKVAEGRRRIQYLVDSLVMEADFEHLPPGSLSLQAWVVLTCVPAGMRELDKTLLMAQRAVERDDLETGFSLDVLALAYHQAGDDARAAALQAQALQLPPAPPTDADWACRRSGRYAHYLRASGDHETADKVTADAITAFRETVGADAPSLAEEFVNTGTTLAQRGHYVMAEAMLSEALELNRRRLGSQHATVAETLTLLADVYFNRGKYAQAEKAYEQALTLYGELYGDDHLQVAVTLYSLGAALQARGDYAGSAWLFDHSLEIYEGLGAGEIPEVLKVKCDLARARLELGEVDAAAQLARAVAAESLALFGEEHLCTARAKLMIGWALTEQGQAEQAESGLRECVAVFERLYIPLADTWRAAEAEGVLGLCLARLQSFDEAQTRLVNSHTAIRDSRGAEFSGTQRAVERMVGLYESWGRADLAAEWRAELHGSPLASP